MARTGKISPNLQAPRFCEPDCDPAKFSKHGKITINNVESDVCFCSECGKRHFRPMSGEDKYLSVDPISGKEFEV